MSRFKIGYELMTSGWEAYEAIVEAKSREEAERKVRKFVDTYDMQPGMEGEPEMVNAQNETHGVDEMEIIHVEKLTPSGGRVVGPEGYPMPGSRGLMGPFSKRRVDVEDSRLLLRTLTKRLEGPGKGWHGEPGRHRAAAKKGRK